MNINKDYMSVMRYGAGMDRLLRYRSQLESGYRLFVCLVMGLCLVMLALIVPACAEITDAMGIRCVIGEAADQGLLGMLAVASGIRNRGTTEGIYGCTAPFVDKEPMYVWEMAMVAWELSAEKLLHDGTHWENIKAFGEPYWVKGMIEVYRYRDHVFYKKRIECSRGIKSDE